MTVEELEKITDRDVGHYIASARRHLGMSQTALGEAIGVSYWVVRGMEQGEGLTPVRLLKIAKALGQPLRFFYGEEGNSHPKPGQLDFNYGESSIESELPRSLQLPLLAM